MTIEIVKFKNETYGVRHTGKFLWFFTHIMFLSNDDRLRWCSKNEIGDFYDFQFQSESQARLELNEYYKIIENESDFGTSV